MLEKRPAVIPAILLDIIKQNVFYASRLRTRNGHVERGERRVPVAEADRAQRRPYGSDGLNDWPKSFIHEGGVGETIPTGAGERRSRPYARCERRFYNKDLE